MNLCCNNRMLPASQYTPIFVQAHYHLCIRLSWLTFFGYAKQALLLIALMAQYVKGCAYDAMVVWAILISLLTFASIVYFQHQRKILDDIIKTQLIADSLGQFTPDQDILMAQNQPRLPRTQIEKMIQQIKQQIAVIDRRANTMATFILFVSQIMILKYIYNMRNTHYIADHASPLLYHGNCNDLLLNTCMLIQLLMLVEYLPLYIFVLILLLSIPFISLYLLFKKAQKAIRLKLLKRKLGNFVQHQYAGKDDYWVKDEHECRICMQEYAETDTLMQLPCNTLHHFHSSCIKEWLKVSVECPLCRKQLVQATNIELQELQFR